MQMRSFQHGWEGMRNGNGMNGIKLCFSMKEERKEGRKEGRKGLARISSYQKAIPIVPKSKETIPFLFFFFFFFSTYLGISTMLGF